MAVQVRKILENLGHRVGYDPESGGVLVRGGDGKDINIGSEGFTLRDDGRYYADSEKSVYDALQKNGVAAGDGWSAVRNSLGKSENIGYNGKTGQLTVNGRDYNVDGQSLVKIGDTVYGRDSFLKGLKSERCENDLEGLESCVLQKLLNREYGGYNPEGDENLKLAMQSYVKNAKADMGARGITSDSLISHYASEGAAKLIPKFAEEDYRRFTDENEKLESVLSALDKISDGRRSDFETNRKAENELAKLHAEREQRLLDERKNDFDEAAERSRITGNISEKDAYLLGESGETLEAREKRAAREFERDEAEKNRTFKSNESQKQREFDSAQVDKKAAREAENIRLRAMVEKEQEWLRGFLNASTAKISANAKLNGGISSADETERIMQDLGVSYSKAKSLYESIFG